MVIEWLALWGVAEATAFVFKPILEDLAKDAAKGVAGEYIKSCFKRVFSALSAEPLAKAMGQAVKELLEQIQEELLDHDVDKAELRDWIPDVKQFLQQDSVKEALGDAFAKYGPANWTPAGSPKAGRRLPAATSCPMVFPGSGSSSGSAARSRRFATTRPSCASFRVAGPG